MRSFAYDALPGRVVFGAGSRASLPPELDALGARRVLVVASADEDHVADDVIGRLGERVVGRFRDVVQHVPEAAAEAARAATTAAGADTVLTIGGGSATGFGKAVALQQDVRLVAVPTTYAGSEMTPIWGLTRGDEKRTGVDVRVKPALVVYDPELTLTLPPSIAGPSGMNALAHCVEALYAPGANPVVSLMALEGIRALHHSLPTVCAAPTDLEARTGAQYGAYLAGTALASAGTGLHHKTCHVLGGLFGLDHGGMNAVVLGHALAYNAPAIPDAAGRGSRSPSARPTPPAPCTTWRLPSGRPPAWPSSACRPPASTRRPAASWRRRRGTCGSPTWTGSGGCSTTPTTAAGRRGRARITSRAGWRTRTTSRGGWRTQGGLDDPTRQQGGGADAPPLPPGDGGARRRRRRAGRLRRR